MLPAAPTTLLLLSEGPAQATAPVEWEASYASAPAGLGTSVSVKAYQEGATKEGVHVEGQGGPAWGLSDRFLPCSQGSDQGAVLAGCGSRVTASPAI